MDIYLLWHMAPGIELIYCYGQSALDVAKTFVTETKRSKSQLPSLEEIKTGKYFRIPLKNMFRMNIGFGVVVRVLLNDSYLKVDFINR